jgi:hypothetical protein
MIRKLLFTASLGGLLLVGATGAFSFPQQTRSGGQQSQQATKQVTGKVTSIGDAGKSFSMEVNDGASKKTMNFAVDKNTQVSGKVTAGTMVVVEYQPADNGQNVAVSVTAQS